MEETISNMLLWAAIPWSWYGMYLMITLRGPRRMEKAMGLTFVCAALLLASSVAAFFGDLGDRWWMTGGAGLFAAGVAGMLGWCADILKARDGG